MLMQNFKPAADLGISNAERGALAETLVLLETDKMKLVHRDEDFDGEVKFGFSGQFNMNNWELSSPCGSVCCIGGYRASRFRPAVQHGISFDTSIPADPDSEQYDNRRRIPVSEWGCSA